jgi:hypothetical protein
MCGRISNIADIAYFPESPLDAGLLNAKQMPVWRKADLVYDFSK